MTNLHVFDWVKARAKCSLEITSREIEEVLDSDVKSANALGRKEVSFELKRLAGTKLMVHRHGALEQIENQSVTFELCPNEIKVYSKDSKGNTNQLFSAKTELTDEGDCLLRVSGYADPLRLWQFSKAALEDLLFGF